jgi:hypothetical protein
VCVFNKKLLFLFLKKMLGNILIFIPLFKMRVGDSTGLPSYGGGNSSIVLSGATLNKLQELLSRARANQADQKMRLAALQWTRALFAWSRFAIDTIFLLAGEE